MTTIDDRLSVLSRMPGDVVCLLSPHGEVRYVSASVERTLGFTPEAFAAMNLVELIHPDDLDHSVAQWRRARDNPGEQVLWETRVRHALQGWRWMEILAANKLDDPAIGALYCNFRDVTERKEAEEALRASEERFRTLVQDSTDVFMITGADGVVTFASSTLERVLGRRPQDLVGTTGRDTIHPDDLHIVDSLRDVLTEASAQRLLLFRTRHADGSWRWIESSVRNLLDHPQIVGLVSIFRDVTERVESDKALRDSESRLRAVLEHSRDVHGLLDREGTVVWASSGLEEMLGWRPEDLVGTSGFDLVHPDDMQAALTRFAESLLPQLPDPVQLRLAHADGRWLPIEVAAALWPMADADDDDSGLVVSLRDISWRAEAERALRHSEERFRALVQHSHDGIVVLTPDQGVTYASPSLEQLFGRSAEEMTGLGGLELVHPDDVGLAAEALDTTVTTPGHRATLQVRVQHADGTWRWVECTAVNLADNDAVEGVVINIRDISERRNAEQAVRESERLFRSLARSSPTGVYLMRPTGECTYVNERFQEITGYGAEDAMGYGWHRMVHVDDREEVGAVESLEEISREPLQFDFRVVRPDGEVRWVAANTGPMFDDDGVFQGAVGALEDVTERKEAMRDSQRLTDIFEATHDLVAIADNEGSLLYLNRSARKFFDVPAHGPLESFDILARFGPELVEQLTADVQPDLDRDGMWYGELPIRKPDGTVVPHRAQLLVHKNDDGRSEFFSAVLHDVSERKAIEHRLAHQATHDPLTGLPNRTLLLDRLDQAQRRARRNHRRVAVLFLDLDHFKVVNDSLGHGLGDRLLIAIAERLQTALRPADTVARFGGDEFVVLCEDLVNQQDAIAIAERVNEAISGPFVIDDTEVFVGVSIGIAFPDDNDADPETLIRDADAAMYQAKDRGRARWVVFDNAMRASAVDRLDIENALRRALERRELRVFYQPMVNLSSGRITGVEALLRWEHPERGLLLPGDFITVAEETGLIVPIGSWVLDHACRQVQRWQASIPDLTPLVLAVNLSGRQLGHPRLVEDVATVLRDTGIDPSNVELEMTESVLMDDVEMSEETLGRLKTLGVKLAVDDFGTGYSSLSYLRRFPVDVLKVDQSFVDGLGRDTGDSAIVTAVVTLAHTLGLHAVAEGVETPDQLSELRRLDCDTAQGFHFARPANGYDVGELLQRDRRW
jgi:diguanylate cyclase (GGDEF)-like protein/PAS domain S-box-containing protein